MSLTGNSFVMNDGMGSSFVEIPYYNVMNDGMDLLFMNLMISTEIHPKSALSAGVCLYLLP